MVALPLALAEFLDLLAHFVHLPLHLAHLLLHLAEHVFQLRRPVRSRLIAAGLIPTRLICTTMDHPFGLPHDALGRVVHAGRSQILGSRPHVMDTTF